MLELVAAFICLTTLLTYVNFRFIGLPPTIGVMVTALMFSLLLQGLSLLGYPGLEERIQQLISQIDFGDLLMNWMLSFLLFAGALHVNLNDLRSYRWPIGLLATFGVLIATAVIGSLAYYIFALFGWHVSFLYCLLFGALISPTDPIAVLGVLRTANASKPLKTTIVGESLFNDGTAVVVFTVLLGIAQLGETPTVGATAMLFAHEAIGGGAVRWADRLSGVPDDQEHRAASDRGHADPGAGDRRLGHGVGAACVRPHRDGRRGSDHR
ncbi:NhaP-type Na+/H+ or K+/H+ antiporter [Pseudomonas silensiensis]|nr:NhaP-type Na+/H+ or K+/H+ antiporter [Pseudomonas silensiensis]